MCTLDFNRVMTLVKIQRVIYFFKSPAPYIEENMRDVGECQRINLSI